METIEVKIALPTSEVVTLELSGMVALKHPGSREVTLTCQGDVLLKVVDQGQVIKSVQAVQEGMSDA